MKASENPFPKVRFIGQASAPATPPAGEAYVYYGTDDEFYIIRDDGVSTPLIPDGSGGGGGAGTGGAGGIVITEQDPPVDRGVNVSGGYIVTDLDVSGTLRKQLTAVAAGNRNLLLAAAPATNPRIDIIAVNTSGTIVAITGTEAATPAVPSISNTEHQPLYLVHQRVGSTAIKTTDDGVNSYLQDIRGAIQHAPFLIDSTASVAFANGYNQIKDSDRQSYVQISPVGIVLNAASGDAGAPIYMITNPTGKHILQSGHGVVFPSAAADPAGADSQVGQVYYNTTSNKLRVYNGAWIDLH